MLITESLSVGLITGFVGLLVNFVLKSLNMNYEITCPPQKIFIVFFLTGALIHTFFEIFGLNEWYCKNGVACKKIRA